MSPAKDLLYKNLTRVRRWRSSVKRKSNDTQSLAIE